MCFMILLVLPIYFEQNILWLSFCHMSQRWWRVVLRCRRTITTDEDMNSKRTVWRWLEALKRYSQRLFTLLSTPIQLLETVGDNWVSTIEVVLRSASLMVAEFRAIELFTFLWFLLFLLNFIFFPFQILSIAFILRLRNFLGWLCKNRFVSLGIWIILCFNVFNGLIFISKHCN